MKKLERNGDDFYLLNNNFKGTKIPRFLNDLKKGTRKAEPLAFDLPLARYVLRTKKESTLLPTGKRIRTNIFFTSQSGKYLISPAPVSFQRVDSLFFNPHRLKKEYKNILQTREDFLLETLKQKYSNWSGYLSDLAQGSIPKVSPARIWNLSIVGAVIFGMVTMTFIYRYLGESVSAKISEEKTKTTIQVENPGAQVLGAENYVTDEADVEFVTKLLEVYDKNEKESSLEREIREMVKDYPIEEMIPEIIKKDRIVAAFLVSIAKKESNWGKRVPVLNGEDCYNYWGYRGIRERMGTGGHTCFDSRKDAVDTVAKRLATLIDEYGKNNPEKMVIWKCGSDCNATGGQAAANKWIADVNLYFKKLNK